jgi:hypothetical protein
MNSIYFNRISKKLEPTLKKFIENGQPIENNSRYEFVVN